MVEKILFKPGIVEEAEDYYKKIQASVNQNRIATSLAQIIVQYMPISERALKGFLWRVVQAYQMKHHVSTKKAEEITPSERIKALEEMFIMLKKELTRSLVDQAHESLLDEALNKAMSVYKEKYANR